MFYEQTLYSLWRPPETGVIVVVVLLEFEPVSWESEPVQLYLLAGFSPFTAQPSLCRVSLTG